MSLFDVLRYTISDKPTEVELAALPYDLYMAWLKAAGWNLDRDSFFFTANEVSSYYNYRGRNHVRTKDVALLRKMIAEYEFV